MLFFFITYNLQTCDIQTRDLVLSATNGKTKVKYVR